MKAVGLRVEVMVVLGGLAETAEASSGLLGYGEWWPWVLLTLSALMGAAGTLSSVYLWFSWAWMALELEQTEKALGKTATALLERRSALLPPLLRWGPKHGKPVSEDVEAKRKAEARAHDTALHHFLGWDSWEERKEEEQGRYAHGRLKKKVRVEGCGLHLGLILPAKRLTELGLEEVAMVEDDSLYGTYHREKGAGSDKGRSSFFGPLQSPILLTPKVPLSGAPTDSQSPAPRTTPAAALSSPPGRSPSSDFQYPAEVFDNSMDSAPDTPHVPTLTLKNSP